MCGRAIQAAMAKKADHEARLLLDQGFRDRYNLAPTQQAVTIHQVEGVKAAALRRWGLIPSWAKDESGAAKLINARAETVAEKPSFRPAFKRSRIVVPVSGFYEWAAIGGRRRAYCIKPADDGLWMFAGLAETWTKGPDGPVESCTIITTAANRAMEELHHRMPVILAPGDWQRWLDPETPPAELLALLRPCPDEWLEAYEVSAAVGSVKNDGPELMEPVA